MLSFTIIVVCIAHGGLLHAQLTIEKTNIYEMAVTAHHNITISHFIACLGSWDEMSAAKSVECATTKVLHRERMLNARLLISTT